jgi:serine/threonine protein kinase/thiol-disulfide isomerase/thioredoxin
MRKLGQGGMGAVYEAIDERVSCLVALKETLVGSSPGARQAFQREAALLANLRHAALPKVMDYFGEGEGEFLVMEFISGHDLAELLSRDEPFPQERVVRWAIELLRLLEYLHTREPPILHRDIKPANLKLTKQDEIFLLDFGLAKGVAGQMTTMETDKSVPGYTPLYAPLEQILGQGTDPRSDLYSLGATLYHVLTGQAPVSAAARFDAVENDRPDPLRPANQLDFRIASEVAGCIQSAMALSRKDRPSSAGEMRIAMENAAKVVADRDNARRAEATLIETLPGPEGDPSGPLVADKNVQFTVYTPQKIKPEKNYSVLAFAHLSKRRADAAEDEPDPVQEVKDQAARVLGDQRGDYYDAGDSSSQPVPRGGELTFVPVVQGLTFSPPSRSFTWRKSVHREEFDVRATADVDGKTLKGSMTVFLGGVVIAEVDLTIAVDSAATPSSEKISLDKAQSARRVRQVFAAYSQRDEQVVAELAHVAPIFGSRFVMDRTHLEPGEDRTLGLQRLIRDADVFQLFWSSNSMRSAETVDEIKYAASLGRPGFILPTYWEDPLPRSPAEGLPPPEIERLQFYRIYPGAISKAASTKAAARLVIMGPTGAEIFLGNERSGSIGRSGRVILKSFPIGQHVLRVTLAGHETFETLVETTTDSGDQVVQTQFEPARTVGAMAAPEAFSADVGGSSSPVVIACPGCGSRFAVGTKLCGRCGMSLQKEPSSTAREVVLDIIRSEAMTPAAAVPPQMQSYQAPMVAKRKRGIMMPIYAGAAMVLLVMIVAPVWFMMNTGTKLNRIESASSNSSNPAPQASRNPAINSNTNNTGESLPFSQFTRLEGGTARLEDFRGRVVLLNFWASWCVPCRPQVSALNELQRTFEPRGLKVIGLSYNDTAAEVKQFQKETPQDYQLGFVGNEVGAMFPSLPVTYILDRRGRLRKKMIGQQSRAALEAAIDPLLSEGP